MGVRPSVAGSGGTAGGGAAQVPVPRASGVGLIMVVSIMTEWGRRLLRRCLEVGDFGAVPRGRGEGFPPPLMVLT